MDHFVSLVLTTCTSLIFTATGNEDLEPTEVIGKIGEQEQEIEIDNAAEILKPTGWTVEFGPDGKLYIITGDTTQPC